ncbi:MAG: HAD-IC family P-type ATPase [Streptococcaceae bacterium]|nr:HAD-IC family P-type ATPase [Streptococcaceae bacterium]
MMTITTSSFQTIHKDVLNSLKQLGYSATFSDDNQASVAQTISEGRLVFLSTLCYLMGLIANFVLHQNVIADSFFAITMIVAGAKTFRSAYFAVKAKSLDMNVLMASSALGAIGLGEWHEGATVLYLFIIGIFLQKQAVDKTRQTIQQLLSLTPDVALVQVDKEWQEQALKSIAVGSVILVRSGDKISLDGIISKGSTEVNQASITGESMPISKRVGDTVFAGSLNESGTIEVTVTKRSNESTIAKIISMVEVAQSRRAPIEAFSDRFAAIYTPIVFILAILMMLLSPLFLAMDFRNAVFKGLELLNHLPFVFQLSHRTVSIIKQNVCLALLVKILAVSCIFLGILPIWLAVLSDTGMSVIVTLNALRLKHTRQFE